MGNCCCCFKRKQNTADAKKPHGAWPKADGNRLKSKRESSADQLPRDEEIDEQVEANHRTGSGKRRSRLSAMGNFSCCFRRKRSSKERKIFRDAQPPPGREISVNFLPHISEREPEEIDEDPSTHPTAQPTFMERSKSEVRLKENRNSMYVLDELQNRRTGLKRWNSCSTIYLDDSTISQPHLKNTVLCMSLAVYYHIANRKNRGHERLMEIFEERLHPILPETTPNEPARSSRSSTSNVLLNYAEIDLCPSNWRRIVLGAIMLASKVWDDQAVWNVDYCQILHDTNVDDMNELERQFLECLEFNINVPGSVYAKYYYDLRTLSIANDIHLTQRPLSKERARKLEALSIRYEDRIAPEKSRLKRSLSVERQSESNSRVVIS
ncbi:Cyclin-Y-like protein 1 [Aphelenchoides fujianensis]|nr:Cyclin-Y-like protein 1 [Aphelenchoides fujianensis]